MVGDVVETMNAIQPLPVPRPLTGKSGMPIWTLVLIVCGAVGVASIVIIGMLAAIAIPNFVRARETARTNACVDYLRMIAAFLLSPRRFACRAMVRPCLAPPHTSPNQILDST